MWFVRCLLWATPLAALGYLFAGTYQRWLLNSVLAVLGLPPRPGAMEHVDLSAANALAMYAAMCLASRRAPWRRRLLALAAGLASLIAIEWLSGLVSLRMAIAGARAGGLPRGIATTRDQVLDLIRWTSVPVVWLALLGRWEFRSLPGLRRAGSPPAAPRRGAGRVSG
jgi:hypothetical protein